MLSVLGKLRVCILGGGSACVAVSCGLLATEPPSRPPELTGTITEIAPRVSEHDPPIMGLMVLVEEEPGVFRVEPPQSKKGYFFVADDFTRVLRSKPGGGWEGASVSDLAVGMFVSAWYDEDTLVLSSYPAQGAGSEIAIER